MYSYQDIFSNKQRILFVTAHPDDAIVSFGALIHQLRTDKKEVYVLLVTSGARGSKNDTIAEADLAKKRLVEETAALAALSVPAENLFCLDYLDGEVESDMQLIGKISKYIRQLKVDLVATHEPSVFYTTTYAGDGYFVQHRDHRKIGEAVIDAVYPFSRDRSFFTNHYADGIEPHSVYHILLTDEKQSNFEFDYSNMHKIKRKALRAYKSQFDAKTVEKIIEAFKDGDKHVEKFNYLKLAW